MTHRQHIMSAVTHVAHGTWNTLKPHSTTSPSGRIAAFTMSAAYLEHPLLAVPHVGILTGILPLDGLHGHLGHLVLGQQLPNLSFHATEGLLHTNSNRAQVSHGQVVYHLGFMMFLAVVIREMECCLTASPTLTTHPSQVVTSCPDQVCGYLLQQACVSHCRAVPPNAEHLLQNSVTNQSTRGHGPRSSHEAVE